MKSFGDLSSFSVVLRIAGILQFINKHQDLLENGKLFQLPNIHIKTLSMDLDGDGNLEWLVDATYGEMSLQDWFIINKQKNGRYRILPSEINYDQIPIMAGDTEIAITDLTGDGNPEIIKVEYYYFAGSGFGIIKVYSWRDNGLSLYTSIELPSVPPVYGEIYASNYVVEDFNGDGIAEIRVNFPRFRRFSCQWTQSSIYYLDGRNPDVEVEGKEIPQTDECLIARALESDSSTEQAKLYQEAISNFDSQSHPLDELAWLRLQLAMAYATDGDDINARLQLEILNSLEGDGKFLLFVREIYANANASPVVFCDALYDSISSQDIPKSIGSKIDVHLTHGAYPIDFAPIANLICPFPDVLGERLNKLKIPISESPIDALTTQGYAFVWTQSLNWDTDTAQEWLGVLEFRQSVLVFMDSDEFWKMETIEVYSSSQSKFDAAIYTPAGGAGSTILVLFSSASRYCESPNTAKWLIMSNPEASEHQYRYLCDANTYSLVGQDDIEFAIQEFSKPNYFETFESPDWYYLPDTGDDAYERRTILHLVSELEDDVVKQTNREKTASKISELITSLPKDDPAAQILLSRLYYLRGLNYELSGQNELAVDVYLDLIEFSPESLWSQYAKIRIQPGRP